MCSDKLSQHEQRHYTPGQRLNSAAEVMQALLDGQKVAADEEWYLHLVEGRLIYDDGVEADSLYAGGGWHIYTPPKRKVTSTRWFAVFSTRHPPVPVDGLYWSSGFADEDEAKRYYPNALAYVRAKCVVELDSTPGEVEVDDE